MGTKSGRAFNIETAQPIEQLKCFVSSLIEQRKYSDVQILEQLVSKYGANYKSICSQKIQTHRNFINKGMRAKWGFPATPENPYIEIGEDGKPVISSGSANKSFEAAAESFQQPKSRNLSYKITSSISPRQRDSILRRDGYSCLFCGRGRPAVVLEVNHIIPRSQIKKLNLQDGLFIAEYNLCATCFDCNRGKSDSLAKEDVEFYVRAFSEESHPNHKIVRYLENIRALQGME